MNELFSKQVSTFKFDFTNDYLTVYGTPSDPLFQSKEVGTILGIRNIHERLRNIPEEWKVLISTETLGGIQDMVYIKEPALYEIIMSMRMTSSKRELITKFKYWVCNDVLPSIRKTGKYNINEVKTNNDVRIETFKTVYNIFERIGMDERDELMFKDYGRDLLLIGKPSDNMTEEWSISRRLQEKFNRRGNNQDYTNLGRRMAKAYRSSRHRTPPRRGQFVGGTLRSTCHYTEQDFNDFGDDVISDYYD